MRTLHIRYADDEDFIEEWRYLGRLYTELQGHVERHRILTDKCKDYLFSNRQNYLSLLEMARDYEEKSATRIATEIRDRFYTASDTQKQSIFN